MATGKQTKGGPKAANRQTELPEERARRAAGAAPVPEIDPDYKHDEGPPGGRYIVGDRAVNARNRPFSDDPRKNLARTREELDAELAETEPE